MGADNTEVGALGPSPGCLKTVNSDPRAINCAEIQSSEYLQNYESRSLLIRDEQVTDQHPNFGLFTQ